MVGEPWVLKLHLLDKVSGGVPVREGGVPALLEERGEQALVRAVQEVEAGALQPGGRRRRARLLQERGHSAAADGRGPARRGDLEMSAYHQVGVRHEHTTNLPTDQV